MVNSFSKIKIILLKGPFKVSTVCPDTMCLCVCEQVISMCSAQILWAVQRRQRPWKQVERRPPLPATTLTALRQWRQGKTSERQRKEREPVKAKRWQGKDPFPISVCCLNKAYCQNCSQSQYLLKGLDALRCINIINLCYRFLTSKQTVQKEIKNINTWQVIPL